MTLVKRIGICLVVCLALPFVASAQNVDPTAAGATPLSANFDAWPEFAPLDNGFHNYDVSAIGVDPTTQREEFVLMGQSNDAQCGPKWAIVSANGVETPVRDAFVDDNGAQFIGAAAIANYGAAGGFGFRANVDGDPGTGQFIVSIIFFNNDVDADFSGNPTQAFTYMASDLGPNHVNNHYLCQRYTRDAVKVSNMSAGRNIPSAASHTQDPWFPAAGQESRAPGSAILSNGNSLHYIADRSRSGSTETDKGVVEYFVDNGLVPGLNNGTSHQCNVHTITSPDASTFVVNTTPTYVNPTNRSTFERSDAQQADAGNGWFATRATQNGGTLAFFRNDGSRISQIYGYQGLYQDSPGLLPNDDDVIGVDGSNAVTASHDTLFVTCRYQEHASGIDRPAILRFQVNGGLTAVNALPIIVADSDYAAPAEAAVHQNTIDVHANQQGAFVVGWRRNPAESVAPGAPVARVFKADGTPATGSFYVSSLADPTTDVVFNVLTGADDGIVKVAMNNNLACVTWFTENGVATVDANDCSGVPKSSGAGGAPISTAVRIFQIGDVTGVGSWDLY